MMYIEIRRFSNPGFPSRDYVGNYCRSKIRRYREPAGNITFKRDREVALIVNSFRTFRRYKPIKAEFAIRTFRGY